VSGALFVRGFCQGLLCQSLLCQSLLCQSLLCQGLLCQGLLCQGLLCQGLLCQGLLCQGLLCQGLLCQGLLCQGLLCQGLFDQGLLGQGFLCQGQLCQGILCQGVKKSSFRDFFIKTPLSGILCVRDFLCVESGTSCALSQGLLVSLSQIRRYFLKIDIGIGMFRKGKYENCVGKFGIGLEALDPDTQPCML
jgi:hypothetical protein